MEKYGELKNGNKFMNMLHYILILLFIIPLNLLSQKNKSLDETKIIKLKKKKEKTLHRLKNPKWLTIKEGRGGKNGFFTDNKGNYYKKVSLSSNYENSAGFKAKNREDLMYGTGSLDYSVLEKKITQVALFLPEINELDINIISNCGESFNSIEQLYLLERDLVLIRKFNNKEDFLKDILVTVPSVYRKIRQSHEYLCN